MKKLALICGFIGIGFLSNNLNAATETPDKRVHLRLTNKKKKEQGILKPFRKQHPRGKPVKIRSGYSINRK